MNFNTNIILLLCFFSISLLSCQKEEIIDVTQKAELETVIDSEFKRLQMPGLACIAVKEDSIVYVGYRGYANLIDEVEHLKGYYLDKYNL